MSTRAGATAGVDTPAAASGIPAQMAGAVGRLQEIAPRTTEKVTEVGVKVGAELGADLGKELRESALLLAITLVVLGLVAALASSALLLN